MKFERKTNDELIQIEQEMNYAKDFYDFLCGNRSNYIDENNASHVFHMLRDKRVKFIINNKLYQDFDYIKQFKNKLVKFVSFLHQLNDGRTILQEFEGTRYEITINDNGNFDIKGSDINIEYKDNGYYIISEDKFKKINFLGVVELEFFNFTVKTDTLLM